MQVYVRQMESNSEQHKPHMHMHLSPMSRLDSTHVYWPDATPFAFALGASALGRLQALVATSPDGMALIPTTSALRGIKEHAAFYGQHAKGAACEPTLQAHAAVLFESELLNLLMCI